MKERGDPFERCREDIIKLLEDIGRRQKKPSLFDRITLPFDRRIHTLLARRLEISDDQIKGYFERSVKEYRELENSNPDL